MSVKLSGPHTFRSVHPGHIVIDEGNGELFPIHLESRVTDAEGRDLHATCVNFPPHTDVNVYIMHNGASDEESYMNVDHVEGNPHDLSTHDFKRRSTDPHIKFDLVVG